LPKKSGAYCRSNRRRRQFRQISGLSSSSRRWVRGCWKPVVESEWIQRITEQINDLLAADLLQNFWTIRPTQPRIVLLAPEIGPAYVRTCRRPPDHTCFFGQSPSKGKPVNVAATCRSSNLWDSIGAAALGVALANFHRSLDREPGTHKFIGSPRGSNPHRRKQAIE